VSHNRPMSEILEPKRLDIAPEFERGFEGMTRESSNTQRSVAGA
jgi:hypothetical protein